MAQWRIKEISLITNISVRMLRHYDKLGLLKPSMRSSNGYRWYSEVDLARLQQITALKFFGFSLEQIKDMVQQAPGIYEHLQTQQQMLADQAEHLRHVQDALALVLEQNKTSTTAIDWNNFISLIERYRMTEDLKKTWYGKALNHEQLAEYMALKKKYPQEFACYDKLIEQINNIQLGAPEGPGGEKVVKAFIGIAQKMKASTSRQRKLNADILRSMKEGKITDTPLTPEGNMWLGKAFLAHYLRRCDELYQEITKNLNTDPAGPVGKKIAKAWRDLIAENFIGTSQDFGIGVMLWQELGRQQAALQKLTKPPSPQDMVNQIYAKICFDPDAMSWIEKALNA